MTNLVLTRCAVVNLGHFVFKASFEMDWLKKKKVKKKENKKRVLLWRERGAMLLEDIIKCCDGKSNPIKFFSADLILKATNNFSDSNNIPGFSSFYWDWYSGINNNNHMILIKKYSYFDSYFCRDVAISSMASGHKNFMKLAGCCLDYNNLLMIYYGDKKNYSSIDLEKIVSWTKRMKIAEDIATALAYLHTAFSRPFVYRLMSIDNIFIDEDGVAKLSDFSFCISIPIGETFVTVDGVMGTPGYMDYNYMINRIVSEKTDAYGFGKLMLMLLMGRRERFNEFGQKSCCDDDRLVDEIVDPKMLENMGEVTKEEHCRITAFLLLSLRCLGGKGEVPTMVEVAKALKKIQRSSQNVAAASSSLSYGCNGEVPTLAEVVKELMKIQRSPQNAAAASPSSSRNSVADSYYSDGSEDMDYLQGR